MCSEKSGLPFKSQPSLLPVKGSQWSAWQHTWSSSNRQSHPELSQQQYQIPFFVRVMVFVGIASSLLEDSCWRICLGNFSLIFFIKLVSCSSRGIPTQSCFSHFKNLSSSIKHFFFKDIDIFLPSISKEFRKSRLRAAYWSLGTRLKIAIWSKYKPANLSASYLNRKVFIYLE